jgi:hypothetical protein
MSVPLPAARELLARIAALHPLEHDQILNELWPEYVERMNADGLWQLLVTMHNYAECYLTGLIVEWLNDGARSIDREEIVMALADDDETATPVEEKKDEESHAAARSERLVLHAGSVGEG